MDYKSNLVELENNLNDSYSDYLQVDNSDTRDNLFISIRNLAVGIALADKAHRKYNMELDEIGNEYALRLFERIVLCGFRFESKSNRIPFTSYIRLNIKDVLISDNLSYLKLKTELEILQEQVNRGEAIQAQPDVFSRQYVGDKIYKGLLLFFKKEEITKYLNLSLDIIYRNKQTIPYDCLPSDLRDFTTILICISKRVAYECEINYLDKQYDLKKALESSVRSSVFIAAVTKVEAFPRELLLSLDLESLYRLCTVSGGRKLKIPTLRQLDSIVGAINSVSEFILDGKPYQETLKKSKTDLNLVFTSKTNMHHFISKAIDTFELDTLENKTEPLIRVLNISKKAIGTYVDEVMQDSKAHKYKRELLNTIRENKKFLTSLESRLEELS